MSKSQIERDPVTSSDIFRSTLSDGAQKFLKAKEASTAYTRSTKRSQSSSAAEAKPICLPSGSYPPREHEEFGLFLVKSDRYGSRYERVSFFLKCISKKGRGEKGEKVVNAIFVDS